ncbi:hypothetical protein [uncultured Thiodictyon sp.]|uniref:WD40 repeat domain-containing protein n=1 Tax=uncultured Thiodictyon sp. TaxID=1846217 RepID=UPI0025F9AA62|nr:hypothetical protein [uncultured Thiodictyon sp.]
MSEHRPPAPAPAPDQDPAPAAAPAPDPADPFPGAPQLRLDPGGHTAAIKRVAVDAAGLWLVSGSDDKTVRVWRLAAAASSGEGPGTLERTIRVPLGPGDLGKVYAVALSPDGETVAVGGWLGPSGEDFIYLFDRATGILRQRIKGLPNVVHHLAFDPTGRRLAAVLGSGEGLRLYGLATGGGPAGASAAWSEDGRDSDYGGVPTGPTSPRTGAWSPVVSTAKCGSMPRRWTARTRPRPGPSGVGSSPRSAAAAKRSNRPTASVRPAASAHSRSPSPRTAPASRWAMWTAPRWTCWTAAPWPSWAARTPPGSAMAI